MPLKFRLVQACYVIAAAASLLLGWLAVSGKLADLMIGLMTTQFTAAPAMFRRFYQAIEVPQGLLMAAIAVLFLFLAVRPHWWGKLICLWAALSWTGFALGLTAFGARSPTLVGVLVAGFAMVLVTAVLQALDPRFSGTYLRVGSGT